MNLLFTKQQFFKNLPFILLTILFCGFFFLEKSEHRTLSYIVYVVTFITFKDYLITTIKTIFKDYKLFSFFLCYSFFLSLFHSIPGVFEVGETIRLLVLPFFFLLTCVLVLNTRHKWDLFFQIFILTAFLFGVYAVIEFYIIEGGSFLSYPRYTGPGRLSNANIAGFVYGAALVLFLSQCKNIKEINAPALLKKALPPLVLLVFILVVLGTQSRNSLLSAVIAVGAFLIIEKKYKLLLSIIAGSALIFMLIVWHKGDFSDFISRGSNFRAEIWQYAVLTIKNNMFFGYGYQSEFTFSLGNNKWISPHNLLLGLSYQVGAIGVLLFLLAAFNIFKKNYVFFKRNNYTSIILLIVFGAIFSIFEMRTVFINLSYEWIIFWVPIAFIISQERKEIPH